MDTGSSQQLKATIAQKLLRRSSVDMTEEVFTDIFNDIVDTMEGLRRETWEGTLQAESETTINHTRASIYFNYSVLWLNPSTEKYQKIEVLEKSRTETQLTLYVGVEKENCLIVIT